MNKLLINLMAAFFLFFADNVYAQSLQQAWSVSYGGSGSERVQKIAADSRNGVYSFGTFTSSTFPVGSFTFTNAGGRDLFLIKHDTTGALIWAKNFGSAGNDEAASITTDRSGNIIMAGTFAGTINFGSFTLVSAGGNDVFFAKLDNNGNVLWAKQFSGTLDDSGDQLACDAENNIYIAGRYQSTDFSINGIPLTAPANALNVFYAKLDSNGLAIWAKKASSTGAMSSLSINKFLFLNDKSVLMLGNMIGSTGRLNFDPMLIFGMTTLYSQSFIIKIDTAGNFKYQSEFVNTLPRSLGGGGALSKDNKVFYCGHANSLVDSRYKSYVAKTDSNAMRLGQYQSQSIPITQTANSFSMGNDIVISNDYRVFTVGTHSGSTDFNNGYSISSPSPGHNSLLIWETDTSLVTHNLFYSTPSTNFGASYTSAAMDTLTNSLYTAGYFSGAATTNFPLRSSLLPQDVDLIAQGGDDALISKININAPAVVPVRLEVFTGYLKDNKSALLFWDVTGQVDIDKYVVERSTDGTHFSPAGSIPANSLNAYRYTFIDSTLSAKINYYRLKIINKDGRVQYSNILRLVMHNSQSIVLYPNPAHNILILTKANNLSDNADLMDVQGRVVKRLTLTNTSTLIDVGALATGLYFIKISDGTIYKFIKQ